VLIVLIERHHSPPHTQYLLLGSSDMADDGVDIVVVGHEGDPVAVGTGVV
jgi:hypothetical protein